LNSDLALRWLREALNDPKAAFRAGQREALEQLFSPQKKLIVVQRTGWGKSAVYFLATRLLRSQGRGPTLIVSPLLALMRDQVLAAERFGLRAERWDSSNESEHPTIQAGLREGHVDVLLISPERLAREDFVEETLLPLAGSLGLLVIDEVHCISEWGHDFRVDYQRIARILRLVPANLPVLGTTATANDRVLADIQQQLGGFRLQRGPLVRASLRLQAAFVPEPAVRLAWLAQALPRLPGTGIVYTLTIRDAEVSRRYREELEEQWRRNELKALVATSALGMGVDKPDVGFVIHYQAPSSVLAYYQQIGRAGRALPSAPCVLLSGQEDAAIHDSFLATSQLSETEVTSVLRFLEQKGGATRTVLLRSLNLRPGRLEQVLSRLAALDPAPIYPSQPSPDAESRARTWQRAATRYTPDLEQVERLAQTRRREWAQVQAYLATLSCRMQFLAQALDDDSAQPCGSCSTCVGAAVVGNRIDPDALQEAQRFLHQLEIPIQPKVQIPGNSLSLYPLKGNLPLALRAGVGRALARWGDPGWGALVASGKTQGAFADDLVEAAVALIRERWRPEPTPAWVTCVPSLRLPGLVPSFAEQIATALALPFHQVVVKAAPSKPQKDQQNRYYQARNLNGVFAIEGGVMADPVLLVDDVVDSGWTFTVVAALLLRAGSGPVHPFALATSSTGDQE
jgi:ATP-dependent DNA helicase RecQ